jgi:hypothetical protein
MPDDLIDLVKERTDRLPEHEAICANMRTALLQMRSQPERPPWDHEEEWYCPLCGEYTLLPAHFRYCSHRVRGLLRWWQVQLWRCYQFARAQQWR